MKGFCLDVQGSMACFTRPEMKVERVSYDVITPSAARAIFEAILWKPAIKWRVTKIEVLSPIRWASVRRNEVGKTASGRGSEIFIEDSRQQRAALLLRDVHYRLYAEFDFIPPEKRSQTINSVAECLMDPQEEPIRGLDEKESKYAAMFERRASKGQTFNQPYLGCREFDAKFRLVKQEHLDSQKSDKPPIPETRDLGWMLYDMDFSDSKNTRPMFFRAELKDGVVTVPHPESPEVRK